MCLPSAASAGMAEAVDYLKGQTPDAWITQALIAAGQTNVAVDHLSNVVEGTLNPANDYAKTILALAAAGKNPRTFGEIDYVAKLESYYKSNQMGDAALLNDDIWSLLAFASIKMAGFKEAVAAKNFLLAKQNADGGWGYNLSGGSDTNDTAAAIIALAETGASASDPVIMKAFDYLRSLQNADGGFPYNPAWGGASDPDSDAWVIWALNRLGQDPAAWDKEGNNPAANLRLWQGEDGGFKWATDGMSDKKLTADAVIALAGKSFPIGYFEIPKPTTKLTVNKSALNSGQSLVIKVEYSNNQNWLPLAGATIQGLPQDYTTDDTGQVSVALASGDYGLSAAKEGFTASESVKISVLAPAPDPTPAPAPAAPSSIVPITPTNCQSVEYDVWQNTCVNNWQYRNILTTTPAGCALTAEQEEQRKRACQAISEPLADKPEIGQENSATAGAGPEVLGVKITGLSGLAAEADDLANGQLADFLADGSASTMALGAGERAGVVNSFKSSFGRLPQTRADWEDVLRISINLLPLTTNPQAEARAKTEFTKVYQREAYMENVYDHTAVNIIAYGLRPEQRDLESERFGLGVFVSIYHYLPVSALDWDIIRAIAYSGA